MAQKFYYFRCISNPNGPLLKLVGWEAREMKEHPDYEEVDEFGEVVARDDYDASETIPLAFAGGKQAA